MLSEGKKKEENKGRNAREEREENRDNQGKRKQENKGRKRREQREGEKEGEKEDYQYRRYVAPRRHTFVATPLHPPR
jgi:hypothetical protein